MSQFAHLTETAGGIRLAVRVQPRAGRNQLGDVIENELRIHIAAPPVDSAANKELIRFLAKTLNCAKSAIAVIRGEKSRHKLIEITGIDLATARSALHRD